MQADDHWPSVSIGRGAQVDPEAQPEGATEMTVHSIPRVLLVDDCDGILQTYSMMLGHCAHVTTARSAEEAVALLETLSFDMVVSDHNMPGHDGLWLLNEVKRRNPAIGRVLVAGSTPLDLDEYIKVGSVQRFLTKPVPGEELRALVCTGSRQIGNTKPTSLKVDAYRVSGRYP